MKRYAVGTEVPVNRSLEEIESMLKRYGASSFASGWESGSRVILFEAKGRRLRFDLPLPDANDKQFQALRNGRQRTQTQRETARDAEVRRRFRALVLVVKAKLEAVESGIATFENEFLANIVIPGGLTFGEWARPALAKAYSEGAAMPPLLSS